MLNVRDQALDFTGFENLCTVDRVVEGLRP